MAATATISATPGQRLLDIRALSVEARSAGGALRAVDAVDLFVDRGEIVGLIGESGSGKTTLIRSIIGLHERNVQIVGGTIALSGTTIFDHAAGIHRQPSVRGTQVGMVFQQPRGSLNPLKRIGAQIVEVIRRHEPGVSAGEARRRATESLAAMALDPERVMASYPHNLSGGMCQRAAIAIAVAPHPQLLIADEVTSALDVTSQAEVVRMLQRLVADGTTSMLFVTHDLLLAADICSRIVVLRAGRVVEAGPTRQVIAAPAHDYTRQLLAAVPRWDVANQYDHLTTDMGSSR